MNKAESTSSATAGGGLEEIMKLLKGERDEQRLAGLLLVTKFCKNDDHPSILRVYHALGPTFLARLLSTGMGKGSATGKGSENQDAYLQLAVTLLASFCRVPEIAASNEMLSKIPLILEIMAKESSPSFIEGCYEVLFLVANGHEGGIRTFYESGGMNVLASQMPTLADGSQTIEIAIRLVQSMMCSPSANIIYNNYPSELARMFVSISKQFAVLHNALKFEALHLLSAIMSSDNSTPVRGALGLMRNDMWSTYIRVGVVAILQNRVAPSEKLHALILAESVISIAGKEWLVGQTNLPDTKNTIPSDRCILLVLESSRIEIAVLLNDLAYLKYEASKSSSNVDAIILKQRHLSVAFSLVEKIVKLIASVAEDEGSVISESTFTKIISGLNETTGVVLEYLQDAKVHGQKKGDDLLASVRIIGSYLAEAPTACREKVIELLDFMLLIEGEDEPSPFYSICFMLPMLCQITMENDGCRLMTSSGSYKAVVECLIKLTGLTGNKVEDTSSIFLACDTLMNLLLKSEKVGVLLDGSDFVRLLGILSHWTENIGDYSVIMMASTICTLILDFTSEDALRCHPDFDSSNLTGLSYLIRRSLTTRAQDAMSGDARSEADLYDIIVSGYSRWAERFPYIKAAVEK